MQEKVVLWHIYKLGRWGFEGSIGYVIATNKETPAVDVRGKPYQYTIAYDIVKKKE